MNTIIINNLRIRRFDERNFVIERPVLTEKGVANNVWDVVGYYGRIEDLAYGLTKHLITIPETEDLATQITLLRSEVINLNRTICEQLKSLQRACTASGEEVEIA